MRVSHMTLPKWLTHLTFTGIVIASLGSVANADPSNTTQGIETQFAAQSANESGHSGASARMHLTNYEGYGSAHGSPHHAKGHSGHGISPHGSGHPGGYAKGHGTGAHGSSHPGPHQSASEFIDHVLKFKDGMGITDKQETALRSLETNFKRTRIKLKAEGDLANLELHELLRNDKTSMSDIEAKLKNVHMLKAKLYLASIKARRDAKAVLSEEQRSRMKAIHERIKSHGSKMKDYSRGKSPHGNMPKHGG